MTIRFYSNSVDRLGLRTGTLLGLALILLPAPALAGPCLLGTQGPVPSCESQVQAPITLKAWQTTGWAFYCTGDHPYFYSLQQGYPINFSFDNHCISAIENEFFDGVNKLAVTITNWCLKTEEITFTLGCSSTPQPNVAPCTVTGDPTPDPKCAPEKNVANHCSNTMPPVCVQTYTETCSNNVTYFCTTDNAIVDYCLQCKPDSLDKRASTSASSILKVLSTGR